MGKKKFGSKKKFWIKKILDPKQVGAQNFRSKKLGEQYQPSNMLCLNYLPRWVEKMGIKLSQPQFDLKLS